MPQSFNGPNDDVLLSVKGLKTYFHTRNDVLKAVDDVSFHVHRGETFGIVGESGCGKSIACKSIVKLVRTPPGRYEAGEILFDGRDTLTMSDSEIRSIRGAEISIIFQEPMTALNPVFTIGRQIEEAIRMHQKASRSQAKAIAADWLGKVKIQNPEAALKRYPFTLSGGMRQRVMIAMALACQPKLLIADEPTTALDVTIQAQILDLINVMKSEIGASCIFITHDLGVISEMSDRVMVMYSGKVCETAATNELIENPMHPYTKGLIESRPKGKRVNNRLVVIPGSVPSLKDKPPGCPFHPRCRDTRDICAEAFPPVYELGTEHLIYCWKYAR
jgi:peptide/nickel transport system ATP-binding protein/oligopeptide transport system ATP-binding protein